MAYHRLRNHTTASHLSPRSIARQALLTLPPGSRYQLTNGIAQERAVNRLPKPLGQSRTHRRRWHHLAASHPEVFKAPKHCDTIRRAAHLSDQQLDNAISVSQLLPYASNDIITCILKETSNNRQKILNQILKSGLQRRVREYATLTAVISPTVGLRTRHGNAPQTLRDAYRLPFITIADMHAGKPGLRLELSSGISDSATKERNALYPFILRCHLPVLRELFRSEYATAGNLQAFAHRLINDLHTHHVSYDYYPDNFLDIRIVSTFLQSAGTPIDIANASTGNAKLDAEIHNALTPMDPHLAWLFRHAWRVLGPQLGARTWLSLIRYEIIGHTTLQQGYSRALDVITAVHDTNMIPELVIAMSS